MAITMDQLKGLMQTPGLSGRIAIDSPYGTPQVEKTGIGHFLKTFFGFKSAKAKNEATLNAIRSAFRDDPKLMVGYDRAESMLSNVKGTITAEKVREIINTVEDAVNGNRISADDKQQSVVNATKGRLASRGMPGYLSDLPLVDKGKFMKAYSAHIANTMPDDAWKSTEKQDVAISNATECYEAMFEGIAEEGNNVDNRYWLCKILSSCKASPIVNADGNLKSIEECETFAKDMIALFNDLSFAQKHLALNALESIDEPVSAADLKGLIEAGKNMDKTSLQNLFPRAETGDLFPKSSDLPAAMKFCRTLAEFYGQVKEKVAKITSDKGFSTKNLAQMEKFAFQSALASMHPRYLTRMSQMFSKYAPDGKRLNFKIDADRLLDGKDLDPKAKGESLTEDARIAFKSLRLPVFLVWEEDIANGYMTPSNIADMPKGQADSFIDKVKVGEKDIIHVDDLNKDISQIDLDESII